MEEKKKGTESSTTVFKVGAIALVFLIIGYQSALFVHRAATLSIAARMDAPDTVYVVDASLAARVIGDATLSDAPRSETMSDSPASEGGAGRNTAIAVRRNASHSPAVEQVRRSKRKVESFRFNPNTASVEELMRLGFSEKQAQAIDNYRSKGGRFRRPSDFAASFVVADSVYRRLEKYIVIPKTDINKADSAAFDALPGIGPYFASRMVEYRERLGGYSFPQQLMDIYHFDRQKYDALSDLIVCSPPAKAFRLWSLPPDSLRLHPYIASWQAARSIALFRDNTPRGEWSVAALEAAGIIPPESAAKLARCLIEAP